MQWFKQLQKRLRQRLAPLKSKPSRRFRRLIVEQFEERRVLAMAVDDSYSIPANESLVVNAEGAWANDTYNASWEGEEWGCVNNEFHEGYWEDVWHEEYWDENNEYHEGYWEQVWHEEYWECHEEGWIPTTYYASGGIASWPSHGSLTNTDQGARAFTYEPNTDFVGTDSFIYWIDDDGSEGTATVTITVEAFNAAPTLDAISNPAAIDEDAAGQTVNLSGITAGGGESQALTVTAVSSNTGLIPNPFVTYASPNATGSLTCTPVANQSGTATITVTVRDAGVDAIAGNADDATFVRTFIATVNSVNDLPTLNPISNPTVIDEDAAAQTVNLAGISAGGGESQALTVTAVSSNTGLIPNPSVTYTSPNATGSLTYTPVANQSGTATITVTVRDAGLDATAGNADDATIVRTFIVTVNSVNDLPTLNAISNPAAIDEDAAAQTINLAGISAGGGESQALTVTAVSSNTGLIPNPSVTYASPNATGSLTYTPVANQSGTATITVTVRDAGLDAIAGNADDATIVRTFIVTVNSVNDLPTLNAISNPAAIDEDAAAQTINLAGISAGGGESQALTVTAVSSNTGLIPNPSVTYASPNATGSLTYTPVANQNGTATITVTVRDAGLDAIAGNADDATFVRTFVVTVNSVNDSPVLTGANDLAAINEDNPINDGAAVSTLLAGYVTDVDSGAAIGIAVTAVLTANGAWQYSSNGGSSWTDFGSPSATSARLLDSAGNTRVRFVPNLNWSGTVSGGITFRAWDQTSGAVGNTADVSANGGTTAYSSATASASITVIASRAVDDLYSVEANTTLTVNGFGAWSNDSYNQSWEESTWSEQYQWHDGYWESVWHDGYWQDPVWYDGYWESPVWQEGYWENPEWFDGYWDEYNEWHDGYWDPPEPLWHDGYWDYDNPVWHDGYWDPPEPVWHDGYWEDVWHDGYWEGGWVTTTYYASGGIASGPSHGSLTNMDQGARSFTYTPALNFTGVDSFTYFLTDNLGTAYAVVKIAVGNHAPIAASDTFSTALDTMLLIDAPRGLLLNDMDPDGDSLTVTSVAGLGSAAIGQPIATAHGSLTVLATGALSFMPVAGFSGKVTIPISIGDGGMEAEGEFTVNVGLVATDIDLVTAKNTPITSHLLAKITIDDDAPAPPTLGSWTQFNLPTTIGGNPVSDRLTGTMMLLTDGTVMIQGWGVSKNWYRLTPNSTNGSYIDAGISWSKTAMHTERLYFGSNILPNGKLFLLGGEYTNHTHVPTFVNTGEIFDPLAGPAGTWYDNVAPYPESAFGDQSTILLPSGKIIASHIDGPETHLYDYLQNTWSPAGIKLRNERGSETNWALLPDGGVLSYDIHISNTVPNLPGFAQRYDPILSTWVDAGRVPVGARLSSTRVADELGPGVLLPNGKLWFIGADPPIDASGNYKSGAHTALFDYRTNTWEDAFADISVPGYAADDAPAAPLPNGDVIFTASVPTSSGTPRPGEGAKLFRYDYVSGLITELTGTPGFPTGLETDLAKVRAFDTRMLVLPTGQILISTGASSHLWAYTPPGVAPSTSRPTISGLVSNGPDPTTQRETFTLTGQRLNGVTEGAAYGDDAEMSTNFPIVQLTNTTTNVVVYARTFDWTPGVATGDKQVTTQFDFPGGVADGHYRLRVIANGIASDPVSFSLTTDPASPTQRFTNPTFSKIPTAEPLNGTFDILNPSTGEFRYTPNLNYFSNPQPDSFQYQVNYGQLPAATAKVTIDVKPFVVKAIDHIYSTPRLSSLSVAVESGLLFGATGGAPQSSLSIISPTNPLYGQMYFKPNGSFIYVPKDPTDICPSGCTLPSHDSFTYSITDGTFVSSPATVVIQLNDPEQIHAVDDVYMIAVNDYLLVDGGRTLRYPVETGSPFNNVIFSNMGFRLNDVLTRNMAGISLTNTPIAGETFRPLNDLPSGVPCPWGCGVDFSQSGNFYFDPPLDFIGTKTFQYTYSSAAYPQFNIPGQISNAATVNIIVVPRPIAAADSYEYVRGTTLERESTDDGLLFNDVKGQDPDNGNQDYDVTLSINALKIGNTTYTFGSSNHVVVDTPNVGQLIVKDDGRFGFAPANNFNQDFTFSYQIDNGLGRTQHFPLPDNYMWIIDSDKGDPLHHRSDFVTVTLHPKSFVAQDDSYSAYTVAAAGPNPTITMPTSKGLMANDSIAAIVVNPRVVLSPGNPPVPGNLSVANDGSFTFTPNASFTSAYTFNYTITSDNSGSSNEATVTINTATLQATDDEIPAREGLTITRPAPGILANDEGATGDTLSAVLLPPPVPSGSVLSLVCNPLCTGGFTYTPAPGFHGVETFNYQAQSSYGPTSNIATITFRVRELEIHRPVAVNDTYSTPIGTTLTRNSTLGFLANDTDPNDPLSALKVLAVSKVLLTTSSGQESLIDLDSWAEDGSFTFAPPANFLGTATFSYVSTDGDRNSDPPGVVTITVTEAANHAPTLAPIPDPGPILEDAVQQTINLSGITAGPNETQTLTLTAVSSNPGLIPTPGVTYTSPNATGSLAYTPVADQNGSAVITVTVTDSGGTANGGVNTFSRSFTVSVTAVNDAPTLNSILDPAPILEDAVQQTINLASISAGPTNEQQTLTVTAISSNPSLIPNPGVTYTSPNATGSLAYTPVANQNGSAVITVTVTDNGGTANGGVNTFNRSFTVSVTAVNDAPALTGTDNLPTITEDDVSNNGDSVLNLIDGYISDVDADALMGIAVTGKNNINGTWQYSTNGGANWTAIATVSSSSALLLRSTDRLRFQPNGQNGTIFAWVSFRAWDQTSGTAGVYVSTTTNGGATAFSTAIATASISVTSINDAPVLTGADNFPTITEDEVNNSGRTVAQLVAGHFSDFDASSYGLAVTGLVNGNGSWQYSLNSGSTWIPVGAVSGSSALLLAEQDKLRFVPNSQSGTTASITIRAWDQSTGTRGAKVDTTNNGGTTAFSTGVATSTITVISVNDPPSPGADQTAAEDGGPQSIPGWASAGPPDEAAQNLTFLVTSNNNPDLFLVPPAMSPSGTLTFTPVPNARGTATIDFVLQDDGGTANGGQDSSGTQTFTITITKEYPWNNTLNDYDADNDGLITARDPHLIIAYINSFGSHEIPANAPVGEFGFLDVNRDHNVAPDDALEIINYRNAFIPVPWRNTTNQYDVDYDGIVTPNDAQIIIDYINAYGAGEIDPDSLDAAPPFYDVNGDNYVVAGDALSVINWLNAYSTHKVYIDGIAYIDLNDDGFVDGNEPRLQGVTVTIDRLDGNGNPLGQETVVTDVLGRYRYLHSGTEFTVTQQQPAFLADGQETARYPYSYAIDDDQFWVYVSSGYAASPGNNYGELAPAFASNDLTGDGLVIATEPDGDLLWSWRLAGWRNMVSAQIDYDDVNEQNPASATLKITDTAGVLHTIRIHQDPSQNIEPNYPPGTTGPSGPRFSILDTGEDRRILRIHGTAAQFGLNLRPS